MTGIVLQVTSAKHLIKLKAGGMKLIFFLPLIAEIIAFLVVMSAPVYDWVYYAGSAIALAISAIASISMIKQYNLLTTRPIPEFHNREGGNKDVGA